MYHIFRLHNLKSRISLNLSKSSIGMFSFLKPSISHLLTRNITTEPTPSVSMLPHTLWTPDQEFRPKVKDPIPIKILLQLQSSKELFKIVAGKALNPRALVIVASTFSSVFIIGMYEGYIQMADTATIEETLAFMTRYAWEQSAISVVWDTKPPELSALACGMDPSVVLKEFQENAVDARIQLTRWECETWRCIIAGYLCLGQLFTLVNISMEAVKDKTQKILNGKISPYPGISERVIRLSGRESPVAYCSLGRMGNHIIPIFEDPERTERLVAKYSEDGKNPVYWQVNKKYYGSPSSYSGFNITDEWLLRASSGGPMLYMEADISSTQQGFQVGVSSNDLNIEDASQAFGMLERRGRDQIGNNFRPFRVILGDMHQSIYRGGAGKHMYNLRQRISERNEAEVCLDSKAPIFREIISWCRASASERGAIVFETDKEENFSNAKQVMFAFGFTLYDHDIDLEKYHEELKKLPDNDDDEDAPSLPKPKPMPRLIYYKTSGAAINAAVTLCNNKVIDPTKCCILTDKAVGQEVLSDIVKQSEGKFKIVCSAEIYDDLFRQVRVWARMGYTGSQIQREIDGRYSKIHDILEVKIVLPNLANKNNSDR